MSRSANDETSETDPDWQRARNQLFGMIMEGRSFSGRERNCCFLNTGQERFGTISAVSGLDFPDDARCIAVTDWDQDGDQDMWISNRNAPRLRFMRNDTNPNNRFLSMRLRGNGTTTNRDAIGARVIVEIDDPQPGTGSRSFSKTLRAGEGFLSQSSKWMHFGLGTSGTISRVVVRWPGGDPQTFEGLSVNSRYRLSQGRETVELIAPTANPTAIQPLKAPSPDESKVARIFLETRVLMPSISFSSTDGTVKQDTFDTGVPTLVNLWASWCGPCAKELAELTAKRQLLEDAGVRVISLSVDQLGEEPTSIQEVATKIRQIGYAHPWGFIDAAQMDRFQEMHNLFFFLRRPLPLPSSFLIDASGRLSVIYKGPASVEQILDDVRRTPNTLREFAQQAAQFPGHALDHARVHEVARRSDLLTRQRIAAWLQETGSLQDAVDHYLELAKADPDWPLPQRALAKLFLDQNQLAEASTFAQRALQLDSENADAHNTFGLICSRRGDPIRAESHFRKSIKLNGKSAGAYNNLGIVMAMQGKIKIAEKCFLRAVKLDPEFVEAHVNLGNVYAGDGEAKRAIEHYERAIKIDPDHVDAYSNLGTMFGRMGKIEQAIKYYREALRLDPQNQNVQRNLNRASQVLNAGKKP